MQSFGQFMDALNVDGRRSLCSAGRTAKLDAVP
jgi:hypothetical protein